MARVPDHEKQCGKRIAFDISGDPPGRVFHARGADVLELKCDLDKHGGSPWHGCTVTLLDNELDVGVPITVTWREPDRPAITPTQTAGEIADVLVATGQG